MSFETLVPITYESSIGKKKKTIEQRFTANGEDVKIHLYEFSNDDGESAELLLALIQDFDNMVTTYDLFNVLNVTRVID